jgi:hypothetical protein
MNNFTVATYSPSDVQLIISGYEVRGWESITIERLQPGFTPFEGIRGKDSRTRNKKSSARIDLAVMQTHPLNNIFSQVHALDLEYGTGRLEITLKDNAGTSLFSSIEAYIVSYPTSTFGAEIAFPVWSIYCQNTETYNVGGNTKPQNNIFSKVSEFLF